ncbi:MAG: hypothetical protein JNL35_14900 [Sphingopyxis sp.]|nr:hypothetical protein [Sphingopyxis sp.]
MNAGFQTRFGRGMKLATLAVAASALLMSCKDGDYGGKEVAAASCPEGFGWAEGLKAYLAPTATMPTAMSTSADDCLFNQWSWEAFVWANAPIDGTPRFLSWQVPDDLIASPNDAPRTSLLRLDAHMKPVHAGIGTSNQDNAIVEADGSMLIGQNGYPVYASIHMTPNYYTVTKRNLIATGAYESNPNQDDYYSPGDAIVKATWYRLADGETAPAGTYTTQAEVPVLQNNCNGTSCAVVPSGKYEVVTVALVGMHVVGYVDNHPEFLWATFEHKLNAPMFADNTFTFDPNASNPGNFTFYKGGTPYSQAALLVETNTNPATVTFDAATGKFSPVTNIVQMNQTGGDTQPNGPSNIAAINVASQKAAGNFPNNSPLQNYNLIGTAWFKPNTYVTTTAGWQNLNQTNAVGAVSLMNSTAETFLQSAKGQQGNNCFECHSATSFSYAGIQPKALPIRRIAISHLIAVGSAYEVPNTLPVKSGGTAPAPAKAAPKK